MSNVDVAAITDASIRIDRSADHLHSQLLQTCQRFLKDLWSGSTVHNTEVTVISGGITNSLYKVSFDQSKNDEAKHVLVRVFGDKTEILIDRTRDNFAFAFMGQQGIGPACYGIFQNGRVEGWVDSYPLKPHEMGELSPIDNVAAIAKSLVKFHELPFPDEVQTPILWQQLEKWYDIASKACFDGETKEQRRKAEVYGCMNFEHIRSELAWMQRHLPSHVNAHGYALERKEATDISKMAQAFVRETVFAHNDLLSGNVLASNGDPTNLTIIDYEYGAYNYRGFDIANHFCEHAGFDFDLDRWYPKDEVEEHFVTGYISHLTDPTYRDFEARLNEHDKKLFHASIVQQINEFALASHYWWGLWAVVQAMHSPIDFDFISYSEMRFRGYMKHKRQFFHMEPLILIADPEKVESTAT